MIKEGMIVKYAPEWCAEGEEKLLHVVKENRMNPITGEMTRWLIDTINSSCIFGHQETVDDCMIIPTGYTVEDLEKSKIVEEMNVTYIQPL